MEEEQNFQVEQPNGSNSNGSKKGLIIAIVVIVLALIGGLYYYFFVNNSTKLQISNKDKLTNAFDKVESKVDEIIEGYKPAEERKISKNLATKPFTTKSTISAEINNLNMDGITETDVATIKQMLAGQQIEIEGQASLVEGKIYAKLTALGQEIGNLVLNNNIAGVKIPSNEKYYAISKDSLTTSKYSELAEIFDNLTALTSNTSIDIEKYKLSESENKHFEDTYGNILKNYITEDRMNKESTQITVNGKNQKCDKVIYTLDNETLKSILKEYVTTIQNDTEGQNIILNKVLDFAEEFKILEEVGVSKDLLKTQVATMLPTVMDNLISSIDSLSIEKVEIVVYASNTETYKIEAEIFVGGESAKLVVELKDKGMNISLESKNEKLATLDIENDSEGLKATVEMEDVKVELADKAEQDGSRSFSIKASSQGTDAINAELKITTKVNEDTENRLNEDTKIAIVVTSSEANIDLVINLNNVVEIVDSITVPEINESNSIDAVKEGYLDKIMEKLDSLSDLSSVNSLNTLDTDIPSFDEVPQNNSDMQQ